jgi:hypothetical protein
MNKAKRQLQRQLAHIRSIEPESLVAPEDRFRLDVKRLEAGSVFRLDERTYRVLEVGTYVETDDGYQEEYDWTGHEVKAVCLETGVHHHLEWEEDDALAVSLTLEAVPFSSLQYDDGESIAPDSDDLDEIVDNNWEVVCRGKTYHYDDDYAALYRRSRDSAGEKAYFYEFAAQDGEQLTVELWISAKGKEELQVFISREIPPEDIEVMATPPTEGKRR